jgi:O-antigen/teichoic acid export membrane protein
MKFDLFKRATVVAAGNSAVSAVDMFLGLALVAWLPTQTWNEAAVILMIFGTCRSLGQLGIQEGIYFFYSRVAVDQRRSLVGQTMLMLATTASILAAAIQTLPYWLSAITPAIGQALPLISLAVLCELPSACTPQVLIAAERPSWASAYQTGTGIINTLCVAGPLVLGWGAMGLATGMLVNSSIRLLLLVLLAWRAVPSGKVEISWVAIWDQIKFTIPLALSVASSVLNRYIDKWIVSFYEPDQVGVYTFAATELPFVTAMGYALSAVLSTRMTFAFQTHQPTLALRYWLAACARGALVVCPLTVGVLLIAPEVVRLFFEPAYLAAIAPFQIYNLILFQRVMGWGMIFRSAGRPGLLWLTSFGLLGLNTLLSWALTSRFGIVGAAIGTLIATAAMLVVTLSLFRRVFETSWARVFPWIHYARFLALSLGAAGVSRLIASRFEPGHWHLVVEVTSYAGLVLLGLKLPRFRLPDVPEDTPELTATLTSTPGR